MDTTQKKISNKIGLKLWTPNVGGYLRDAKRLFAEKHFDYIELYASPDSSSFTPSWETIEIPFVIHCAHSLHGFNLSIADNIDTNRRLFLEAVSLHRRLNAKWIIVHPGILGKTSQTILQLQQLMHEFDVQPTQILVENKPFINLLGQTCVGGSPESMKQIVSECGTEMVLDVGHAIKYAIGSGRSWQAVLEQLMLMQPPMLHISDALMSHPKDEHMHMGEGEFDFDKIFSICCAPYISIETVKDHPDRLDDFVRDATFIKTKLASAQRRK